MHCSKRIIPNPKEPRLETYCMKDINHDGKCSVHEHDNICNVCTPPQDFKTMNELLQHVKDQHRIWKG